MSNLQQVTIEALFLKIDDIPAGHNLGKKAELLVPYQVTCQGCVMPRQKLLNAVHDKMYGKGYESTGFVENPQGMLFNYCPIDRGHLEAGYYTELQNRLFDVFRHVSCDERNFSVFSITLASIFLDAASFFDSLSQTFIRQYLTAGNAFEAAPKVRHFYRKIKGESFFTMNDYRLLFEAEFQFSEKLLNLNCHGGDFYSQPAMCFRDPTRRFNVKPYQEWSLDENPKWWKSYTQVKHDRIKYLAEATLGNTIKAFGAVLIILTFFHRRFMQNHPQALETFRLLTPCYWEAKSAATIMRPVFTDSGK